MRRIAATLESLAAGLLLAAVLFNLANVFARYVFARPIVTAEEILQYANVWVVMLAMPAVTLFGVHLSMDFAFQMASARVARILDFLITLLGIVLTIYVVVQSVKIVAITYAMDQHSIAAGLPIYLISLAVPVGFTCAVLFLLERLWRIARGLPPHVDEQATVG